MLLKFVGMLKSSSNSSVESRVSVSSDATSSLGMNVSMEVVVEKREDPPEEHADPLVKT